MSCFLLLPQVNGHACVNFGCTHSIDRLFRNLPIYLLGFFSRYECWVTDLIMPTYIILYFWVVTCLFESWGFSSLWNVKKKTHMTNFFNKIFLINIKIICFWWNKNLEFNGALGLVVPDPALHIPKLLVSDLFKQRNKKNQFYFRQDLVLHPYT